MTLLASRERHDHMPRRFRLIPDDLDDVAAIQIVDEDSIARAILWAGGLESTGDAVLIVPTADGVLRFSPGDYLVKDVRGGPFIKMSAADFEKKYELTKDI